MANLRADSAARGGPPGAIGLRLYRALWWLGLPAAAVYLLWRSARQPEYRRHWRERFLGRGALPPAGAPVIWVHAVSVGETRAAQPLIEALARAYPRASFVLTHMTPTGRAVGAGIAQRLAGRLVQRYLPYDVPFAVRRFLAETRPALGLILETELWPQLLIAARQAGVKLVLANARLSERSLAKALRYERLVRLAAQSFACVAAQSQADAERIARLYAGGITVTGNLKFDLTPDPALVAQGVAARAALGARPVWLLASTREGEEGLLLDAFRRERAARGATATPDAEPARQAGSEPGFSGGPLLVVVPRHPQRFDEVARLIEAHGFSCARRSQGALLRPASPVTVILGDSIGELALYYAAADVAFIGGSLLPYGGQNLIEACAVGCPVVLGPSTFNFAQAAADAIAAGAAVQVSDADQVMRALRAIATDAGRREAMRQAALAFASAHRGATARTLALITAVLAEGAADAAAQPAAPPADRA